MKTREGDFMDNERNTDVLLDCEICLSEIPESVGHNAEADEYVSHYCGLECYQRWQESQKSE